MPLLQHVIMIDAGSTGSRVHVYRFNNCDRTPQLEEEFFQMTEKRSGGSGLSAHKNSEEAAASLDGLMQFAQSAVPEEYHSRTPVAVKATAGLRLLGRGTASKILAAVRTRLEARFPFPVVSREKGGVEIMNGEDEAAFAWLTVNYLLGKLEPDGVEVTSPSAAIIDLGGGSIQVVFRESLVQGTSNGRDSETALLEGEHHYRLKFGGKEVQLYQHSYLGYGLMAVRNALHQLMFDRASKHILFSQPIFNPCLPPGSRTQVTVEMTSDQALSGEHDVIMEGPIDDSDLKTTMTQCRKLIREILHKDDTPCPISPCSINGVYQPSIEETVSGDIYVFSYFYDRTHPLGIHDSFTQFDLDELILKVCGGEKTWVSAFGNVGAALKGLREMPEWCLDLQYMQVLLCDGFEVANSRRLRVTDKIDGYEVGWSLGASLALLEGAPMRNAAT